MRVPRRMAPWAVAAAGAAALFGLMAACGRRDSGPRIHGGPAVSPDGSAVAFGVVSDTRAMLMLYDLRTKMLRRIVETSAPIGAGAFTPDGNRVLYCVVEGYKWGRSLGHGQLYLVGLDGSDPHRLLASSFSDKGPSLNPDDRTVVFTRSHRQRRRSMGGRQWTDDDLYRTDLHGTAPTRLSQLHCEQLSHACVAADSGSLIFSFRRLGENTQIHALDASGALRQLTDGPTNTDPAVDRRGNTIVFVSDRAKAFDYELWSMHVDATDARQVTRLDRTCKYPAFFPDGRSVVFVVDGRELWRVDLDGSHLQRLLTVGQLGSDEPVPSPTS